MAPDAIAPAKRWFLDIIFWGVPLGLGKLGRLGSAGAAGPYRRQSTFWKTLSSVRPAQKLRLAGETGPAPADELVRGERPGGRRDVGRLGEDGEATAGPDHVRLAGRDEVVRRGERVACVGLAKQVLVLEEQHRVLDPEGGAEQPGGVAGPRRERDQQAGHVGEDRLPALRV